MNETETDTPRVNDYIGTGNEDNMTEGEIAVCEFAKQLERDLNEAIKQRDDMAEALRFYADKSKYKAPLTGGFGELYFDCGQVAGKALSALKNNKPPTHHEEWGDEQSMEGGEQ